MTSQKRTLSPQDGKKAWRRLIFMFASMVIIGGGTYWWTAIKTYHFAEVQPGVLYRDGNQGMREFATALSKSHPKTVISLIDDKELNDPEKKQFAEEAKVLEARGIHLERIPIPLGGWPTEQDVEKFNAIVSDSSKQPVLVHCAQGVRRTGMMVAAYQEKMLGFDNVKAEEAILPFRHSERTLKDIRTFIHGYDPKTGAVPTSQPISDE